MFEILGALALAFSMAAQPAPYDVRSYLQDDYGKPTKPLKPGAEGDDSCRWANDRECDEPGIGTGACDAGTDHSDCWRIMQDAEDDSCQWANDGECDEPGIGTGACTQGTDRTDCAALVHMRFTNDSCATAFDGVCNEPDGGDGTCEPRTDRADCGGRERPSYINDHFFGRDDRVLMDTGAFPWSVIGEVTFDVGGNCTATLIGEEVLVTAAHCIHEDGVMDGRGVFVTGRGLENGPIEVRVIDFFADPDWRNDAFMDGESIDGTDWAFLRLERPLGAELGHVGIRGLVETAGEAGALEAELYQAGYSWDTGDNLSGNLGCHIVEVFADNTMAHECDTTRGDSGSPFMVRDGDDYFVVAVDSNFRPNEDGPTLYIAARSERWLPFYDDFAAGRIGSASVSATKPGKPVK